MFMIQGHIKQLLENLEISGNFKKCYLVMQKKSWKSIHFFLSQTQLESISWDRNDSLYSEVKTAVTNMLEIYRSEKAMNPVTNHTKNDKHAVISYTSLQLLTANITDFLSTWWHFCQNITVIVSVKLHDFNTTRRPSALHIILSE